MLTGSVNIFKPAGQGIIGIDLEPLYNPQTLLNMVAPADSLGVFPDPDMEVSNLGQWEAFANEKQINSKKLEWITDATTNKDFVTADVQYIFWDPGVYQLSGAGIIVKDSSSLNSILPMERSMLFVMPPESLMDTTVKQQELRPIKSIIREAKNWRDYIWLYALIILVALTILALFLFKRFYKKSNTQSSNPATVKVYVSPYDHAIEQLESLRNQQLWQQGKIKEYQSKLTSIIRKYISDRYDIPAMENTSDEIIRSLRHKNFDPTLNTQLKEILTIADLVKFAKADPPEDIHERFMDRAYHLVNATQKQNLLTDKEEEE